MDTAQKHGESKEECGVKYFKVWGLGMETRERLNGKTKQRKNVLSYPQYYCDFAIISRESI